MNADSPLEHDAPGLDTVYVRTPRGNDAARSADSDLPRMMKTLLIAVDGRTSVQMFQRLLPNFGDVGALLEALLGGGYISATQSAPAPPSAAPPARPRVVAPSPAESRQPSRWFESTQHFSDTTLARPTRSGASLREVDVMIDTYAPPRGVPLSGHRSAVTEASRVREARTLMSDFLFANLPAVAMEAVLALERLETTEQIVSNLTEYQRLVASCGRKGAEHVSAVRNVLAS